MPKMPVQVKNHLAMPVLSQMPPPASIVTSSTRPGANLRTTKSFNSKSLTRPRADPAQNQHNHTSGTASSQLNHQPDQHPQCSLFFTTIEQNINALANSVNHLANVIGSMESRFLNIENSIARITTESPRALTDSAALVAPVLNTSDQLSSSQAWVMPNRPILSHCIKLRTKSDNQCLLVNRPSLKRGSRNAKTFLF